MARYLEIEKHIDNNEKISKEYLERHALERKYNKAKPEHFFEYMLDENIKRDPEIYLYAANRNNWDSVRTLLNLTPKHLRREITINILRNTIKKADSFINSKNNINAIKGIAEMYDERIRNIEDWKPKRNNTHTVLRDLLNHLFANYYVPAFLVNGFINQDLSAMLLYCHIGAGKSMKKFELIPDIIISNKALHHLLTTPDDCSFYEAFRRAQVIHNGGDDKLFQQLMRTRLFNITITPKRLKTEQIQSEEFWLTVIKFFIEHPMINSDKIPEIIDYIFDQKYILKRIQQGNGTFINKPEQPNFTMKGRTPMSIINHSDEWHRLASLNTKREKIATSWEPVNIDDYHQSKEHEKYSIIQLTKTDDLIKEGNKMKNCVATYASSCINKSCSIFSLRYTNMYQGAFNDSKSTIEVRGKSIVQIRGKYNHKVDAYYLTIINKWMEQNKLTMSKYAI